MTSLFENHIENKRFRAQGSSLMTHRDYLHVIIRLEELVAVGLVSEPYLIAKKGCQIEKKGIIERKKIDRDGIGTRKVEVPKRTWLSLLTNGSNNPKWSRFMPLSSCVSC